jgi:hypothetical protein
MEVNEPLVKRWYTDLRKVHDAVTLSLMNADKQEAIDMLDETIHDLYLLLNPLLKVPTE